MLEDLQHYLCTSRHRQGKAVRIIISRLLKLLSPVDGDTALLG